VFEAVRGRARLAPPTNPFACNCVILPDDVAVHLNINDESPYGLDVDEAGAVCLFHNDNRLAEVSFPPDTDYYKQITSAGTAFAGLAVLEGDGVLAFFYLWPCEYVKTDETCTFCFQVLADKMGYPLPKATPLRAVTEEPLPKAIAPLAEADED